MQLAMYPHITSEGLVRYVCTNCNLKAAVLLARSPSSLGNTNTLWNQIQPVSEKKKPLIILDWICTSRPEGGSKQTCWCPSRWQGYLKQALSPCRTSKIISIYICDLVLKILKYFRPSLFKLLLWGRTGRPSHHSPTARVSIFLQFTIAADKTLNLSVISFKISTSYWF